MWSRRDYEEYERWARRQLWESRLIVALMYAEALWRLLSRYAVYCVVVYVVVYCVVYCATSALAWLIY